MLAIGIDLGTTGIGGVLFDTDSNKVIKSIMKTSSAFIKTDKDYEKIQDTEKIISIAKSILDELLSIESKVSAIGVTGQMHGIVYVDSDGIAVSPLYTWQDERASIKNATCISYADMLSTSVGYGFATDYYNRENGLVPKTAVTFCTIADYLVMRLTKRKTPIIHTTNLASFGCFDLETFSPKIKVNAEISNGYTVAGDFNGIPVAVAIGDNQASVLSSTSCDGALITVGSCSQVSVITDKIIYSRGIETRPYFENKYLAVGSALCGGRAYSLIKDFFAEIIRAKVEISDEEIYQIMNTFLEKVDSSTIKCDTRFAGARGEENISGSYSLVTVNNFTPSEFLSATLFGMAEELYSLYQKIGVKKSVLIGSGNGVRKNKHFIKIVKKVFNSDLLLSSYTEEASVGASIYALISAGFYADLVTAQRELNIG